jgi:hypothetical protein
LEIEIAWINFSIHEWPSGVLNGNNFVTTMDECKMLLKKTEFVKNLDRNKKYTEYINDYENKIKKIYEKIKNNGVRRNCV